MTYISTKTVSTLNCPNNETLRDLNFVPLGASAWTSSGQLAGKHITAIAQAASGSMTMSGPGFEPTRESVAASIENSLALAAAHGRAGLAIPFIGGGIFYRRILPKITKAELAEVIVKAAEDHCGGVKPVIVAYDSGDHADFQQAITKLGASKVGLVQGSITDHNLHGCDAIVNAANMEVRFGGGISGAIGRATHDETNIDKEALAEIKAFWSANPTD